MWTIPDLVQEIESIGRMLQIRLKAFTAGSKKAEEFEKGMLHTLCSKINGLNVLSIMDAQQLYQAISSSDLNEGQQSAISECIDAKLTEEKETHASSDTLSPQLVEHLATYLTNAEWAALKDPDHSLVAKSNVIAKRLKLLGVKSLHEQTCKWAIAILLSTLTSLPDYQVIYDMVGDFKDIFSKNETVGTAPYLKKLPEKPDQLTEMHFVCAYGDKNPEAENAPVIPQNLETIKHIASHHIPLRKNSKLLKKASTGSLSSSSPAPAVQQQMMMQVNPVQMMQMWQLMQQQAPAKVQLSPPKTKAIEATPAGHENKVSPKKRTLPIMDAPKKATEAEDPHEEEVDYEEAAFKSLKSAKNSKAKDSMAVKRKPAAACKAKTKASAKKPSGSSGSSAVTGHMRKLADYKITEITDEDLAKPFNLFGSRHWHRAKNLAMRLGHGEEEAQQFAKKIRADAKKLYDSHK